MVSIKPKGVCSGWNGKAATFDGWRDMGTAGRIYTEGNSKSRTFFARMMSKARRRNDKRVIENEIKTY